MPRLELNGIQTHYQQRGQGPDVVLIHAFTSNLSVWFLTPLVDTLARDFRVTAYDLRGHGLTAATLTGYASDQMARDFAELHSTLGLGPAWLVGHSYGGVIAVRAALEAPQKVRGVILSDTYFPALRHLEPAMGQSEPWQDLRVTFAHIEVDLGDQVDFSRLFRAVVDLTADQRTKLQEIMGPAGSRWITQMGKLAATRAGEEMFDIAGLTADRIGQIEQPVVALYDEFSPFAATQQYLQQHLSQCVTDIVPGAKHLAPVQSPVEFTSLVHNHLLRWQRSSSSQLNTKPPSQDSSD